MKKFRVFQLAALFATAILLVGCGDGRPARVPVSGEVYIDGKPLTAGAVMFVPKGARPSSGTIDAQGRFTLTCYDGKDGAVPGKHAVSVVALQPINATSQRWLAPKKYADHRTSGLEVTVDGATNSLQIDLTWAGGSPFIEKINP